MRVQGLEFRVQVSGLGGWGFGVSVLALILGFWVFFEPLSHAALSCQPPPCPSQPPPYPAVTKANTHCFDKGRQREIPSLTTHWSESTLSS